MRASTLPIRLLPLSILTLLAACSTGDVKYFNSPPTVTFIAPVDGDILEPESLIEFIAQVDDAQTGAPDLKVLWESNIDGELDSAPPDSDGTVYYATNALTGGQHAITLTVTDQDDVSASASIGITVGQGNTTVGAPTITMLNPTEGAVLLSTQVQNVLATIADDIDRPDALVVEILDVPDGLIFSGSPTVTGNISVPWDFSLGAHSLTLTAVDSDNHVAEVTTAFEMVDGGAPTVTIQAPRNNATVDTVQAVNFQGLVGDDLTPIESLTVEWSSDQMGTLSANPADSSGDTTFSAFLTAGTHTVTLSVSDTDGKVSRESVIVNVDDPLSRDDDGDGYSENQGDCEDDNPLANPAMVEICDDSDNDCNGYINDNSWDSFEPNDTSGAAYDFGAVGDSLWSNQTVNLAGLTIHEDDDEDWYRWETGDIFIIDNVDINVTVYGLPNGGNYIVELWNMEDNVVVDSDSGSGTLTVQYSGDWLEDGEETWAVNVHAMTWPANSCSTTYTLVIRS